MFEEILEWLMVVLGVLGALFAVGLFTQLWQGLPNPKK